MPPRHPPLRFRQRIMGEAPFLRGGLRWIAAMDASRTEGTEDPVLGRLRVVNTTREASPDMQPYSFVHTFAPGAVPAGTIPEPRLASDMPFIAWQLDRPTHRHPDGSMNRAVFTMLLPEMAAGEETTIEVRHARGPRPAGGTLTDAPLRAEDYRLELDLADGGGTWTAALARLLDEPGAVRPLRDGPILGRWLAWGPLRDGAGTAHPQLWARFHASVVWTGTRTVTQVMASLTNGGIGAGRNYRASAMRLTRGGEAVWSYAPDTGRPYDILHHTTHYATSDGEPYWSALKPVVHHKLDRGGLVRSRAWFPYGWSDLKATPDTEPAVYIPGVHFNTKLDSNGYAPAINAGGAADYIGPLPNWSVKTLAAQTANRYRLDKVLALMYPSFPNTQWWEKDTATPPVFTDGAYPGLPGDHRDLPVIGPSGFDHERYPKGTPRYNTPDGSHQPEPAYVQMLYSGEEWFEDIQLSNALQPILKRSDGHGAAREDGGEGEWQGIPLHGQVRGIAWSALHLENTWWSLPDDHVARAYMDDLRANLWGWLGDRARNGWPKDYAPGDAIGLIHGLGGSNYNSLSVWQNGWLAIACMQGARHGAEGAKALLDYNGKRFTLGIAYGPGGGLPYNWGTYYIRTAPVGKAKRRSGDFHASYDALMIEQDTPYIPPGRPEGFNPDDSNSWLHDTEAYVVVGWLTAKWAVITGQEIGDAELTRMGRWIDDYVKTHAVPTQRIKFQANMRHNESWIDQPKNYGSAEWSLDYPATTDHTKSQLVAMEAGAWTPAINRNQLRSVLPDWRAPGDSPYYRHPDSPERPAGGGGPGGAFSYSSGVLVPERGHFVRVGGGHNDWPGSEVTVFDFASQRWYRTDDSARYVRNTPDTGPYPRAPHAIDDRDKDFPKNYPRNWPYPNVWGRWAPWSLHTYGSVVYAPDRRRIVSMGSSRWPESGTVGGYAVIETDGYKWHNDTGEAHPQEGHTSNNQYQAYLGGGKLFRRDRRRGATQTDMDTGAEIPISQSAGADADGPAGCIIPDPGQRGRLAYVALRPKDTSGFVLYPAVDGTVPQGVQARSFGNATPADVDDAGAWVYMGEHRPGAEVIVHMQPLPSGIVLYMIDMADWTWHGPLKTKGAPKVPKSVDNDVWRRFGYMPRHDAFYWIENGAGGVEGTVYVLKRPAEIP